MNKHHKSTRDKAELKTDLHVHILENKRNEVDFGESLPKSQEERKHNAIPSIDAKIDLRSNKDGNTSQSSSSSFSEITRQTKKADIVVQVDDKLNFPEIQNCDLNGDLYVPVHDNERNEVEIRFLN